MFETSRIAEITAGDLSVSISFFESFAGHQNIIEYKLCDFCSFGFAGIDVFGVLVLGSSRLFFILFLFILWLRPTLVQFKL